MEFAMGPNDGSSTASDDSSRTRPSLIESLNDPGKPLDWDRLDRRYRGLMMAMARNCGLDHHDAEDVVQNAFRTLGTALPNLTHNGRVGAFRRFLDRVVRSRGIEALRSRSRRRENAVPPEALPEPPMESLYSDTGTFQEAVTRAMGRCAADLRPRDVQVLDLYFARGCPAAEVARSLGLSEANVHQIASRHRDRLCREVLRELGREDHA